MAHQSQDTTGPGGRSEPAVKWIRLRASPVLKQETTEFKLKEPKVLSLAINISQPLLDPLEQYKRLTIVSIHKKGALSYWGENNLRQPTTYSVSGTLIWLLSHTRVCHWCERVNTRPRPCSQQKFHHGLMPPVFSMKGLHNVFPSQTTSLLVKCYVAAVCRAAVTEDTTQGLSSFCLDTVGGWWLSP